MGNDWNFKALRVDLDNRSYSVDEFDQKWLQGYLGGRAFGAYHLLKEVPAGADPLGPENKLIFATGILANTNISGASRFSTIAKSPLTGGYGEAEAGGWWGPELVRAGYNAVILEGQADSPVYIWIHDGEVEIRDADEIWGLGNKAAYDWLQGEIGQARVASIGPAGENMVRYACIANELRHINGRTGLGAVMGSKKIKAIAVKGSLSLDIADQAAFDEIKQWHNQYLLESFYGKVFRERGTAAGLEYANYNGSLPTRNWREMTFLEANNISSQVLVDNHMKGHGTCRGCVLRCKPIAFVEGDDSVDPRLGGPEYEGMAALGPLCGMSDMPALIKMSAMANDLGMDVISLGCSIAFAMECFDEGLLTKDDTDGLELKFGDANMMIQIIEQISTRQGFGDVLADGTERAAEKIGNGSQEFVLTVKGQELPMHDPRAKPSQALAFAVSPTGAEHMTSPHDGSYAKKGMQLDYAAPLGITEPVEEYSYGPEKVDLYVKLHHERSLYNSLLMCAFVGPPMVPLTLTKVGELVRAVTGWDIKDTELLQVGERGTTLARMFNVKHGLTPVDDRLPPRMFKAITAGPKVDKVVDKKALEEAIAGYYQMMGWDSEGVPTQRKLEELGLSEFI